MNRRQPMPVLNAMEATGSRVLLRDLMTGETLADDGPTFYRSEVSEAVRVWVGDLSNWFELIDLPDSDKSEEVILDSFQKSLVSLGPQRLPFPDMWIELALQFDEEKCPLAVHLREGKGWWSMSMFSLQAGNVVAMPILAVVYHDDCGVFSEVKIGYLGKNGMQTDHLSDDVILGAYGTIIPTMWAVGLMNCRNVGLQEIVPEPRRTKKQRRPRKADVSYRTIVLPSPRRGGGPGIPLVDPASMPLHKVRGHTKTYTADAPLLGKHVGTYWWGCQVRGSRDNGEIVSDYRMTL